MHYARTAEHHIDWVALAIWLLLALYLVAFWYGFGRAMEVFYNSIAAA